MLKNPHSVVTVVALVLVAAILAAACSVIYVSDHRPRLDRVQNENPACLIGCEVNNNTPAASAPAP